ncbi:hypothetical protein BEN47_00085 [Hymenobacter lapidarius]|uniref:DUF3108 domain-containing protein n=1 Tax=Hymenobacter lapidarius TaxID=1908237 RepID=A0A1G1T9R9_9BACT|nr:hypothetical protein BEN47_00085 [Hymenobacter lapidarius]
MCATACSLLLYTPSWGQEASLAKSRAPHAKSASQPISEKAATCTTAFNMRPGQNLEYQLLDGKGKALGTWRYRVVKVGISSVTSKKGKATAIASVQVKSGLYDTGNNVLAQQDLTFFCRNDTTFTDGLSIINYDALESFNNRRLNYQATPIAWPNQPATGSKLPNGGVLVQVSSPSVAIAKVETTQRQRKVSGERVSVRVPAGTFSCYPVESQREVSTAARADLVLKNTGRQVDYYDPAVGIVKTEQYDNRGKLVQTRLLSKH